MPTTDFELRLKRVDDAVRLAEPDKMPITPITGVLPFYIDRQGATNRDGWYRYEAAGQAQVRYHKEFEPDASMLRFQSGPVSELAGAINYDWPGNPLGTVADESSHQVTEHELMTQEEYPELIQDFTGFMLRKYIPRAFPKLAGLGAISFNPAQVFFATDMNCLYAPEALEAYEVLQRMAEVEKERTEIFRKYSGILAQMGFPPLMAGFAQVPFDIISNYFRGTMGMFDDQMECPEQIEQACTLMIEKQLEKLQYLRSPQLPVKRVFIPMHKGMDGFMSPQQYRDLYWAPFLKLIKGIVDLGAVPVLYTEGRYATRVQTIKEGLMQLPKGSCILHFEHGDFVSLKKEFEGIVCLSGGMPVNTLAFGSRQEVIDRVKYLVDNVAAGGGYLFNASAVVDNAKRENIEAMFETAHLYGSKH